jgi:VCBS repeat-containing protein
MDPLDKRYHDQLEPQEQSLSDGGDLHAGQQSETQPWHQSGLAADIDRRLAQVQQQERWLQQQQHPDLLTPPAGGQDSLTGQQDASRHQQLVVVDTSRNDWQQRVAQLAPEADLLLLSGEEHGLERISQAVARQPYRTITLLPGSDGNGRRFLGADALQESSSLPQKAALQVLAGDLPHSLQEALAREHSLSVLEVPAAEPILTRIENDASALLSLGRDLLREAQGKGRLQQTIEASFAAANQAAVLGAALALINGESRLPQIQWAHFGKGSVRGAFLQERNTVLISDQLRGGGAELEAVLLHEIGHWLEANTGTDSPGDEGESFSARIRGATPDQELIRDSAQLSIDGVLVQAELMDAMPTSGDITPPALISDQQSRATLNSAGSQITLNFSETLQSASISPSQFSFSDLIGGQVFSGITVSSITVNGSAVVLNLNTPLSSTQAQNLKLRYQPSALFSERLEDTAGNGVADFEVVIDFSSTSSLVNQAPATVLDSASLLEDGVFTRNASQGVLSNDSDPNNGDQLRVMGIKLAANAANTVAVSTGSPGLITNPYGTLSINADGSYRFSANGPSSQSLRAGAMATTSFTVVVSDGALASESTLSFAITGTNDAPTVSGLAELGSIQEDGTFIITSQQLLAIASDIDAGDTLSVANLTLRSGQGTLTANINGTWTFSPAQNWNGEVRFSYQISDGTVTIGSPRNDLAILGNSLYLLTDNGSWTQTEARAQQLGGHLATINDALENQFIWNQFTNQAPAAWIGYNKESGTYEWSSGERSPYTNWHPGSPDFS